MESPLLWAGLAALILLSGVFSGTETALFSLTPHERARASARVRGLLDRPRDLLVTVLFANLVVNVLFFAFSRRLMPGDGGAGDLLSGLAALVAVLIGGEILPKTLSLRSRVRVAHAGARLVAPLLFLLGPLRRLWIVLLEGATRLLGRWAEDEPAMTPELLALVLERTSGHGALESMEADLLAEIVELEGIRVREIMTPRVDVTFLAADGSNRAEATRAALDARISWLPVMGETPDAIRGRVRVRDLLLDEGRALESLIMPVKLVPEVASVLHILRSFHEDRTAAAVVIDEWGGTAGIVTLEDIFEEIVGELRTEDEDRERDLVPLGEGRYRVSGGIAVRDWNELFGYRVVPAAFETLGGFVTALLGRIPRTGDVVHYGALELEVNEVRGRRVLAVDVGVRPVDTGDGEESA